MNVNVQGFQHILKYSKKIKKNIKTKTRYMTNLSRISEFLKYKLLRE